MGEDIKWFKTEEERLAYIRGKEKEIELKPAKKSTKKAKKDAKKD